ncbi:catalase [Lacipirellula parvula]|uniref:Catalase n=1 Tax=Lacipirellula parvula TaxID=2650471 RepID=A0A5K7XGJ6_9BACT|nr:catalase [Lacipirellula parvula]BBO35162.1 catalase KatE-intracellular protease [Lacipirellula parvula]
MAKASNTAKPAAAEVNELIGNGGELHQQTSDPAHWLTTNQGLPIADDQNSLKAGDRGPTLLEDFHLREKITHFDHERIPERVVHARGYGAHGYFQAYEGNDELTKAAFLCDSKVKTPVFCRFSTVAGSEGSVDTPRDVRGFAVKFYTSQGNYDLVGNNIPVFFIQDAIKFPDLIHAVKPEPDRAFPQAASAHDTFWDFVSLTPESTHMLMWAMSDRAIPRSLRMMEGFGVHTFRLINAKGKATLVKFHWRPKLGTFSLIWDEAVAIAGADADFHRRDLWDAIQGGDFPEWELSVQAFDEKQAAKFDFDVLDPTKLIPEEIVPLRPLGKMVLNRMPDNFFAETEQVAFCPANLVPGIDLSEDPLLQGRLFSYLDTQLSRLGSANFQEIPINAAKCPWQNMQRDGHMRMRVDPSRTSYEPNSLDMAAPREAGAAGFESFAVPTEGTKLRQRPESFADHYTQAHLFYKSMTETEQRHIVAAFAFELGKCKEVKVRTRMLGRLEHVDPELAKSVADKLGMPGQADKIDPAVPTNFKVKPSPALSQYRDPPQTIAGKKIGLLVTDGSEARLIDALIRKTKAEKAKVELVAPKIGGITDSEGVHRDADQFLAGAPSAVFDAVCLAPSADGVKGLVKFAAAVDWLRMAFAHLKIVGYVDEAVPLFDAAHIDRNADDGLVELKNGKVTDFIEAAKRHRIWEREPKVR